MNLTAAQSAAARHDLALEHAPKVLASAEGMVAKGLFPPDVALDRAAEGWAKRIASGRPYVSRARGNNLIRTETTNLVTDLPFDAYAQMGGWNWSKIKAGIDGSPKHIDHARRVPRVDTAELMKLRAIHTLTFEPDTFDGSYAIYRGAASIPLDRVVIYDETKTRSGEKWEAFCKAHESEVILTAEELKSDSTRRTGKAWEAFCELNRGLTILKPAEYDAAHETAEAVRAHPFVAELLSEGAPEVTLQWVDPETGLPMKGRIDWFNDGRYIVDLKTGGTTHERLCGSMIARNKWHGQMAHYDDGARVVTGRRVEHVYIIAAEGKGAQDVAVGRLGRGEPDGPLHVGHVVRREMLTRLAESVDRDDWPGRHPHEPFDVHLPSWALLDNDDDFDFEEGEA